MGLLGRGGMGEVYRADDLTLGQAVALKFLPEGLQTNAGRRERFREEVRIARQIAHPNVCRVYDIGEYEGRTFTTMEFVDGEDLVSLLRRIGRLPQEKGLEIARQLCAGLAAIHDRGVLHRDLKPANVMIDGRGRVRITDFGLSAAAGGVDGGEVRAGTPAYMAPEQLSGREVTAKSDVFALGLVLYEIFTGKRAFDARSIAELQRLHRDSSPASPSTVLPNLDPVIERVIERCLDKDPARRPSSAIAIAAALPGGDPVAAALAAGETPSPEMVAASGKSGGVRPVVGLVVFVAVLVALFLESTTLAKLRIHRILPFERPPAVLDDRARQILARIGHDVPPGDHASGFDADDAIVAWVTKGDSIAAHTDALRGGRIPLATYWIRQSRRTMLPQDSSGKISPTDPAPVVPGMSLVSVDPAGRLVDLRIVPESPIGARDSLASTNWSVLFEEAGLDPAAFTPVEPERAPPVYAEERAAWTGTVPGAPEIPLRVEAAAAGGKPVWFASFGPWAPLAAESAQQIGGQNTVGERILTLVVLVMLGVALFLAHRNLRLGRGDRRGSLRLMGFLFGCGVLGWMLTADHVPEPADEMGMVFASLGIVLFFSFLFVSFYLALEPYVRRLWPDRLVSWTRLLLGRWRDPLVGRDILVGGAMFFLTTMLGVGIQAFGNRSGAPTLPPKLVNYTAMESTRSLIDHMFSALTNSIFNPMFFLLFLVLLRVLLRRQWIAAIVFVLLAMLLFGGGSGQGMFGYVQEVIWGTIVVVVLIRFGLLAFIVGFFLNFLVTGLPLTLDASHWWFASSCFVFALAAGLIVYGIWAALSGRSLLRDELTRS